jgi:hypothetical protein
MPKYVRSRAELEEALLEQRQMLKASCVGYDAENLWEAKRIATVLYTLFHDGSGRTVSLLSQLGIRSGLRFHSARPEILEFPLSTGLVLIKVRAVDDAVTFIPMCQEAEVMPWARSLAFGPWWDEPVYVSPSGRLLSRKNLVFAMRCQDGGAHLDAALRNEEYAAFRDFDGAALLEMIRANAALDADPQITKLVQVKAIPNALSATMRHMAWEVESALFKAGY